MGPRGGLFGRSGEEKNLVHLPGIEPRLLGSLVSKLSIIPTELYWIVYEKGLKFYSENPKGKIPSGISRDKGEYNTKMYLTIVV